MLPGLDPIDLRSAVERLRELAQEEGRDPDTLPIHGRVYLGEGWQQLVDEALELGFASPLVRVQPDGDARSRRTLTTSSSVLEVKSEIDRLVG